jgi:hypothetical protein
MSPFDALYTIFSALTDPQQAPLLMRTMGTVWLGWFVFGAVFTGIGAGVRRLFGVGLSSTFDWLITFWVGWAVSIGILQLWHLALPINIGVFTLLATIGFAGLVVTRRDLISQLQRLRQRWRYAVAFTGVAFLLSNSAIGPASEGDFALYHQQAILWAESYPAVPGLGNLHGRLAFNNSVFLYAALVNVVTGAGNHIASSLLVVAAVALAVWGIAHVLRGDASPTAIFAALMTPAIAWTITNNEHIRTPDNDLPTILLGLVIAILLLTVFKPSNDRLKTPFTVFAIILLAAAGTSVKLSFAAFGGTAALLALWAGSKGIRTEVSKLSLWVAVTLIIIGGGWITRGVILSGYPAYPTTILPANVDWRVTCEAAQLEADYVRSWARLPGAEPGEVLGNNDWLLPWLVRTLRRDDAVFTPLLILAGTLLVRLTYRRRPLRHEWWLMVVPMVALIAWFISAPDVRFAGAAFWVLGYGAAAIMLSERAINNPNTVRVLVIAGAILLAYDQRDTFLTYPPALETGFHRVPSADVTPITLSSGLTINIPKERAETGRGDERCYAADLPCAPTPPDNLQLREPGNLRAGFRVTGPLTCE